ncbi:MAG: glycosyltransferase family 4 protein [Ignavibacteriales bacterium]
MKPKILHIIGRSSYDGTCIFAVRLIRNLNDYESEILFIEQGSAETEILKEADKCHNMHRNKSGAGIFYSAKVLAFFLFNKYDIIHYHSGGLFTLLTARLMNRKIPVIHHLQCGNINGKQIGKKLNFIEKYCYRFLKNRTTQIAVARHVAEYYQYELGISQNLRLVPNTVPFSFRNKDYLKNRLGYIGQISRHKGFLKVVELCEKAISKNIKIVVKGDNYLTDGEKLNLSAERFIFEEPSLNVENYYHEIDLLLFTSAAPYEGMPLVLQEAVRFDVGIIALRTPATREILGDYPLMLESFETNEIEEKLELYYSSSDFRRELSSLHRNIAQSFPYNNLIHAITGIYESKQSQ